MNEYEVIVENMTPCGGSKYAAREYLEIEAESPLSYVEAHKRYPITDVIEMENGDTVILTGNAAGYITRYTFTR